MKATRKDTGFEIEVRKMDKAEMPDDGIVYYADDKTFNIYEEEELDSNELRKDTK